MNHNNKLPKDWKIRKLGEIVHVFDNLRKPVNSTERQKRVQGKTIDNLFPYYGATGQVGWIDTFITEGDYILIGEDGAPFLDNFKNKAYKISGKTWVNNHAHILKEKEGISLNNFILNYLNSIDYRPFVNGTTRLKLTKGSLIEIPFPLPTIEIQQAIVSKIEELFSELDKGIEDLKTAQQQLIIYRQSVLKFAFEGKLTTEWRNNSLKVKLNKAYWEFKNTNKYINSFEIKTPNIWIALPIGNICEFQQGMQIAKNTRLNKEFEGCLPILRIKNYKDSFKTDVEYIKINENSLIAEKEDIIMTRTGESRGNILTGFKGVFHNNTFRINYEHSHLNRQYLIYYLKSTKIQNFIKENSGRTGQPDLTHRNFGPCPIAIPTLEEQCKIVQEIESRLSVSDKMEESIIQSLQQAEALRQSILKKAFNGELV